MFFGAEITVKGEEQKFVSLHLRQGFNRHHTFTVVVNYLSPNNTFQQTPEKLEGGKKTVHNYTYDKIGNRTSYEKIEDGVSKAKYNFCSSSV